MLVLAACGPAAATDPGPELQVLGESTRIRREDPVPQTSPWFDGVRVSLFGARGETLGIQILHRDGRAVQLAIAGVEVRGFAVESFGVRRPSTAMYGGSRGEGNYADGLVPDAAPATNPAYFEIVIPHEAAAGAIMGELRVGDRGIPVVLVVAGVTLPDLPPRVWAYEDPRELAVHGVDRSSLLDHPGARELACIAMFRRHGVLLSPDLPLSAWPGRAALFAGIRDVPAVISTDPEEAAGEVRGWIAATHGTTHVPFAIPIDEPHTWAEHLRVRSLATAVRRAGGGPRTFRFAVTDTPRAAYRDLVDLYIHLEPRGHDGAWTYNGAPPRAGSMVLDAVTPGPRTWGWIAWRYEIPTWYVWDALYWHDRHNRGGAPFPGRPLDLADPVSFDGGEDHGNLDGVLALPATDGCRPTLRLAAVRRGQQDRALLELAARCAPAETAEIARALVPRALGEAPRSGEPAWPTDEAAWELARRKLLALAACVSSR